MKSISRTVAVPLGITLLCGAVGLLAQGARFSDRLDMLAQLAPLWLAVGLVSALAAAALSPRGGRLGALSAGLPAVLSAGLLMAPEYLAPRLDAPPGAHPTLKVVQFNLWADNRDIAGSLAWILAQHADVVVLEEAQGRTQQVLEGLAPTYPYRVTCLVTIRCSTTILSRRPPVMVRGLQTPARPDEVRILGAVAAFDSPDGPYTVVGVHLARPNWPRGLQRAQFAELRRLILGLPGDRLILAGDFNATPWSFALSRNDQALPLVRRTRAMPSFPAARPLLLGLQSPIPLLPIDHIYAGRGWRTASVTRGPRLGSDHYPVVASFVAARP
jgi:endonuclease/exonuclease/phosphatase (EEP) superfamily protein YafD